MRADRKQTRTDAAGGRRRLPIYFGTALALSGVVALAALQWSRDPTPALPDAAGGRTVPVVLSASCPTPQYPGPSAAPKETGVVMLNFLVGADGAIIDSRVETSSGHAALDEAARAALSRCRFQPGTLNGRPEESWHIMKYDWSAAR